MKVIELISDRILLDDRLIETHLERYYGGFSLYVKNLFYGKADQTYEGGIFRQDCDGHFVNTLRRLNIRDALLPPGFAATEYLRRVASAQFCGNGISEMRSFRLILRRLNI